MLTAATKATEEAATAEDAAAAADAHATRGSAAAAGVADTLAPLQPRVAVLGIGNVLTGDDAFGPFVARTIDARYQMPPGVEVRDIGTPGLDLVPHLAGTEHVIVIDTIRAAAPPGTTRCYRTAELKARGPSARTNPHQPTLADALFFLEVQDLAPEDVLLVGVVPERYDTGAPLSARVRAAVSAAVAEVVRELERLGYPPQPRERPLPPDVWWEEAPVTPAARR